MPAQKDDGRKVVVYGRVARQGEPLEEQLRHLEAVAQERGWEVVETVGEVQSWGMSDGAFEACLEADTLLVRDVLRLSRGGFETLVDTLGSLWAAGVRVVSCDGLLGGDEGTEDLFMAWLELTSRDLRVVVLGEGEGR